MTYVEALEIAIANSTDEVAEKLTALKNQVAKRKGSSGPSKAKVEARNALEGAILEVLGSVAEPMRATEIVHSLNGESIQLVVPRLTNLVKEGKVNKNVVKGVSYYSLA